MKLAGQAKGREAGARANAIEIRGRFSVLIRAFVGCCWAVVVSTAIFSGVAGIQRSVMGCILICGGNATEGEAIAINGSVALHGTKLQNGANASIRGSVTGGINVTVTSHEARGVGAVG
jgi:hypothetical protein